MKLFLTVIYAGSAILSAILWFIASLVYVSNRHSDTSIQSNAIVFGPNGVETFNNGRAINATANLQNRFNAAAALFAGIAATLQCLLFFYN